MPPTLDDAPAHIGYLLWSIWDRLPLNRVGDFWPFKNGVLTIMDTEGVIARLETSDAFGMTIELGMEPHPMDGQWVGKPVWYWNIFEDSTFAHWLFEEQQHGTLPALGGVRTEPANQSVIWARHWHRQHPRYPLDLISDLMNLIDQDFPPGFRRYFLDVLANGHDLSLPWQPLETTSKVADALHTQPEWHHLGEERAVYRRLPLSPSLAVAAQLRTTLAAGLTLDPLYRSMVTDPLLHLWQQGEMAEYHRVMAILDVFLHDSGQLPFIRRYCRWTRDWLIGHPPSDDDAFGVIHFEMLSPDLPTQVSDYLPRPIMRR